MELATGIAGDRPQLIFDVRSLIANALGKVRAAKHETASSAVLFATDNVQFAIVPTPANSSIPCGVRYVEIDSAEGTLRVGVMERGLAQLRASVPELTAAWARGLGVPTQSAQRKEIEAILSDRRMFNIEGNAEYLRAAAQLERRPRSIEYRFRDGGAGPQ
jgi:hypothetical protein